MFCKKCGKELSEDALFCSNCGSSNDEETVSSKGTSKKVKDKREKIKPLLIKSSKLSIISSVLLLVFVLSMFFLPIYKCRIEIEDMDDIRYFQEIEDFDELSEVMKNGYIEKNFSLFDEFKRTIEAINPDSTSDKSSVFYGYEITKSESNLLYVSLFPTLIYITMPPAIIVGLLFDIFNFNRIKKLNFKTSTAVSAEIGSFQRMKFNEACFAALLLLRGFERLFLIFMMDTNYFPSLKYVKYIGTAEDVISGILVFFIIWFIVGMAFMIMEAKKNQAMGEVIATLADE